jgi:hypothetical protein
MKKTVSLPALCDRRPKTPRMKEFIRFLDKYESVDDFATDLEKRAYRGGRQTSARSEKCVFSRQQMPVLPQLSRRPFDE